MLTKEIVIGSVTILEDRQLQVREDTVVLEDGVELSRTYFRYVVGPGDNVSNRPAFVQQLAKFLWVPAVVKSWQAKVATMKEQV